MIILVMFLILQIYSVFAATPTTATQTPAVGQAYFDYSSLWSRLLTNPGLQTQAQAYSSPVPASKVSQQPQAYPFPSYVSPHFQPNQAYSYTQLAPSFQSFYQQPTYNYSQNQNASATQSFPTTGTYPGLQNYYPSSFSGFPSWASFAYPGLQPQPSASVSSSTATNKNNALPYSTPAYTLQNGLFTQNGLGLYGQNSLYGQNQQYVYPGYPLSAYNQPYLQTGLSQPQQTANIYGTNQATTQTESGFTPMKEENNSAPETKEKYSSKYTKPQSDYSESSKQTDDDEYDDSDDSYRSKASENYKSTPTYKNHRPTYADEDDEASEDIHKNSYSYGGDKERQKYTRPSVDDDDEDYEESSPSYHTKNCNQHKSSSNYSPTFLDDMGINKFAKQFKAFTKSEKFKSADYSAEPSNHKKVTDYYKEPKRLKMTYNEDSYMSSSKIKNSEVPTTFHNYPYKAPKYTYEKAVDYLPNKQIKATSEKMHMSSSPSYGDSVGHHSVIATVTTLKKYR